ncbi:MAG TPA: pyridoxamine 5'-phosphate oxidase family protein [Actinomycetota bacterium]|nr:pyridoxamine 5'-phosphate oxidase family protein [Actinomycetota bacterium]
MLDEGVRRLTKGPNFAALAFLTPDGSPANHLMWVDSDDEHIILNTETHRFKYRRIQRDQRVAVAIWNAENPYDYVEVRGILADTITGDEARAHIDSLSEKYTGGPYGNPIQSERVILKIRPIRQIS